jgi:formylglycine-generating enzyme required for sulfatase activity
VDRRTHQYAIVIAMTLACVALSVPLGACGGSTGGSAAAEPQAPATSSPQVTYEAVRVGDAGNSADITGRGAVDHDFSIGKYEVTIGQYTAFLNAVAATDDHDLYSPMMTKALNTAGIERTGAPGSYSYEVMENDGSSADRPIAFVSWFDAARFANWMGNGQPRGGQTATTTEDGAYALAGRTAGTAPAANKVNPNTQSPPTYTLPTGDEWYKAGFYDPSASTVPASVAASPAAGGSPAASGLLATAPTRNSVNPNTGKAPAYFIPTEDQWYKAAYYDPSLGGDSGGYYAYPTQSDERPGNTIGDRPNRATYLDGVYATTRSPKFDFDQGYLTDVGAFSGSPSHYGTFDQAGNVFEWNDLAETAGVVRGFRAGSWQNSTQDCNLSSLARWEYTPIEASNVVGIRLAGPRESARAGRGDATGAGAHQGSAVSLAMVVVGDPGNAADETGYGAVREPFAIGKYEVTLAEYAAFLNAVAADDPHGLYTELISQQPYIAGIERAGKPEAYTYAIMESVGSADRPVTYVNWFSAARFANWMSNGRPRGDQTAKTTEDGAYDMSKAGWAASPRGYWAYPTQSNEIPGNVPGDDPNQANYQIENRKFSVTQSPTGSSDQNYLTDVGAFTASASHYGTFDQLGNVYEWTDLDGSASAARGTDGACWFSGSIPAWDISRADSGLADPAYEAAALGFRLAVRSAP